MFGYGREIHGTGKLECPVCHREVPTFRFLEHRRTCETHEERVTRLGRELADLKAKRERDR